MDPEGELACDEKSEALNDEAREVDRGGEAGARLTGCVMDD